MADILNIYGVTYAGVTGIKAKDNTDSVLTYIRPSGTKSITANGNNIDVAAYDKANVAVAPNVMPKTLTANGVYDASDDDVDGYSVVTVSVPNVYTQADEGKVVSNGELVNQTSSVITSEGEYDTTLVNSVTVTNLSQSNYSITSSGNTIIIQEGA